MFLAYWAFLYHELLTVNTMGIAILIVHFYFISEIDSIIFFYHWINLIQLFLLKKIQFF